MSEQQGLATTSNVSEVALKEGIFFQPTSSCESVLSYKYKKTELSCVLDGRLASSSAGTESPAEASLAEGQASYIVWMDGVESFQTLKNK